MRILHIAYQQLRRYGHTRNSWAQKLSYGMIKNDHLVQDFSDRDVAAFEAPLGIRDLGKKKANKRLLETVEAFEPDLVVAGHCDIITNDTLAEIRRMLPHCKLAHANVDPLFVPRNVENIHHRAKVVDAIFVSTGRPELKIFEGDRARVYHIPNPVDASIEYGDSSATPGEELPIDLLFCSNSQNLTRRLEIVGRLKEKIDSEMQFKTFGSFGEPTVWGRDYERALHSTRMALNLNRQEGFYWYSSDRMAQLAGNGILQFTDSAARFDELLPPETLVYFDDEDDLAAKVLEFHHNDDKRRLWAHNAREFFQHEMNSTLFSQYIVEATTETPFTHDYVWAQDINLDGTLKQSGDAV